MKGGKLIGTGSSSCVFNPNFPCNQNNQTNKERISKLLYHRDAKELMDYEKKQSKLISKIKGILALIFSPFNKFSTDLTDV